MSTVPSLPCCYADKQAPTFVEIYETTTSYYNFEYHSHANDDWEIQFMAQGRSSILLDDENYDLAPGDILILGPNQDHSCSASLGRRVVVTFRESGLSALPFDARPDGTGQLLIEGRHLAPRLTVPVHTRTRLAPLIQQLQAESTAGEPMARAMCSVLLGQILLVLAREAPEATPTDEAHPSLEAQQTIERFCAELRNSLDHHWTLSEMVRRSGYSAPQLNRLFEQVTSLSPCRWLRAERIRNARELLVDTDMVMSQIALDVGFESRCHFHRTFRQLTGVSPEQYRQMMRPDSTREKL